MWYSSYVMGILSRWRERRVANIERRCHQLTRDLALLQQEYAEDVLVTDFVLEEERKRLWFKRSEILKKLTPKEFR